MEYEDVLFKVTYELIAEEELFYCDGCSFVVDGECEAPKQLFNACNHGIYTIKQIEEC